MHWDVGNVKLAAMGIFSLVKDKLKTKDVEQQLGVGPRAKSEFFHLQKHTKFAGGTEEE